MRHFLRTLLAAGLLVGGLTFWTTSAEARPWRRGWGPYGGYGYRPPYRPGWGYGGYRAYGFGLGPGYGWRRPGWGYPAYGYGLGGYPGYYGMAPGSGCGPGVFPGTIGWGYPGYYGGTSVSIGTGLYGNGVFVGSYPW